MYSQFVDKQRTPNQPNLIQMEKNHSFIHLDKDMHFKLFSYMEDVDLIQLKKTCSVMNKRLDEFEVTLKRLKTKHLVFLLNRQQRPKVEQLIPRIIPGHMYYILTGNYRAIRTIAASQLHLQRSLIKNSVKRKLMARPHQVSENILPQICCKVDPALANAARKISMKVGKAKVHKKLNFHLQGKSKGPALKDYSMEHLIAQKYLKAVIQLSQERIEKILPRLTSYAQLSLCPAIKPLVQYFEAMN